MGWINDRKHLNWVLDTYERTINLLQPTVATYPTKLANLIEFYNSMAIYLPWRLDNALEDMDENNNHPLVCHIVLLYEIMMRRFKDEMKDLKEKVAKKTL